LEVRPTSGMWGNNDSYITELDEIISPLSKANPDNLLMVKISDESQIVPVFRNIFAKR